MMSRFARSLRIAFTISCGIACALLILLSFRSYRQMDTFHFPTSRTTIASSINGRIELAAYSERVPNFGWAPGWGWKSVATKFVSRGIPANPAWPATPAWQFSSDRFGIYLHFPHWVPAFLFTILAAVPWLRWHFSLRMLLTLVTLLAAFLGTIIALNR
jgi:hypothetical protein